MISYYCKNGQNQILLLKTCQKFSKSDQICYVFLNTVFLKSVLQKTGLQALARTIVTKLSPNHKTFEIEKDA